MKKYYILMCLLLWLGIEAGKGQVGWVPLGSGVTGISHTVWALIMNNSTYYNPLFAGGDFSKAGGMPSQHVAVWYPYSGWDSLGSGTNNTVYALALYNKKLYAGGSFDTAGRIACSHIASWDSVKWDSLQGAFNGNIYALCIYNNALYAGGDFTMANGIKTNRIAKWDGTKWDSVGSGFDSNTVYALAVFNDTLYAGGSFITAHGEHINHIAKWTGGKWDSLQSGTNNTVYALVNYNGNLYAGGAFTMSGKLKTNYISSWHTTHWDSLQSGTNDTVRALNVGIFMAVTIIKSRNAQHISDFPNNEILFVGGKFSQTDGINCSYIAVYATNNYYFQGWVNWGEVNNPVYAIANDTAYAFTSYIGGVFDSSYSSGWINANYVAQIQISGGIPTLSSLSLIEVYPNPSNSIFTIAFNHADLASASQNTIEVYNVLGEKVYNEMLKQVQHDYQIDLSSQPNGIYFYRVLSGNGDLMGEGKIIIQK